MLAVGSAGGHWYQLKLVTRIFHQHDVIYVTTKQNHAVDDDENIQKVTDADSTQPIGLTRLALIMLYQVLKIRPDIIISTGAASGFFAVLFGRLVGAHTIWIDSVANVNRLSLSGRAVRPFCHLHIAQWPHLADGTKTVYWGSLI